MLVAAVDRVLSFTCVPQTVYGGSRTDGYAVAAHMVVYALTCPYCYPYPDSTQHHAYRNRSKDDAAIMQLTVVGGAQYSMINMDCCVALSSAMRRTVDYCYCVVFRCRCRLHTRPTP
jgi:hypothetical protein